MAYKISRHLDGLVEPLCQATADLLREETNLADQDYVNVGVEDDVYDEHDGTAVAVSTKRFIVRCKSRDVDKMSSYALRNSWWQRCPGAKTLDSGYGFTAPPTDTTALVILGALGRERIEFEDETAQLEFDTAVMRFAKQARNTKGPAGFKQYRTVPSDAPTGNPSLPPMPGQRVAAWLLARSEAIALWMEQSTGKTYSLIMGVEETCKPGACQMALIICPKNVRTQWAMEIRKFASKRIKVVRLVGGRIERTKLLLDAFKAKISGDYDWVAVIVAYQTGVNSIAQICAYPWDWSVTDEGHYIKYYRTQRTRAAWKVRDRSKRRVTMTGTPIANQLFDLYSQLEFLGRGWSGFTSFHAFRKFYGSWVTVGRGLEKLVSLRNLPLLQERLARMAFMLKKSEALPDLPPKTYKVYEVQMSAEQEAVYTAVANQLYAEIERDIANAEESGGTVTVTNILTKLLRLNQITCGYVPLDAEVEITEGGEELTHPRQIDRFNDNPKIDELVRYLKDEVDDDSKVIIWCWDVPSIKMIHARLEIEGLRCAMYYGDTKQEERDAIELAWNTDPELRFIVGNPAAGGVGLNLQGYVLRDDGTHTQCDTVCFYSQSWSSIHRSQGEERPRGYKIMQGIVDALQNMIKWSICCVDFCVPNTIDMEIRSRVTDKRSTAAKIQDVREILRNLLNPVGEGSEKNGDGE